MDPDRWRSDGEHYQAERCSCSDRRLSFLMSYCHCIRVRSETSWVEPGLGKLPLQWDSGPDPQIPSTWCHQRHCLWPSLTPALLQRCSEALSIAVLGVGEIQVQVQFNPRNPQKKGILERGNFWEASCYVFLKNSRTLTHGKTLREPLPLTFFSKARSGRVCPILPVNCLCPLMPQTLLQNSLPVCWWLSKDFTAWAALSLFEQIMLRKFFRTRNLLCLLGSPAKEGPRTKG